MNPEQTHPEEKSACPAANHISGEYWRFCPRCGRELVNEKCKLRCLHCHYL